MTPAACWAKEDAERLLGVDAGPPDDVSDASFLATHVTARGRLLRGDVSHLEGKRRSSEVVELGNLEVTLEQEWQRDTPIVWVLGTPGTGKSHLVRYLHARAIARTADAPEEDVVFVRKSDTTSLRKVLERILGDRDGEEIRRLRENLRDAGEGTTPESAARNLLAELGYLIDEDHRGPNVVARWSDRGWDQSHLRIARAMQQYLVSPHVKDAAVQESCFARKIADVRLGKLRAADREADDLEVTPGNMPGAPPTELTGDAQALAQLMQQDASMQERACDLMNHHLDRAVQRVFGITRGLVTDAAQELRRVLAREGKRLWLYFEDFAVLQGIQGELLDVFTSFDDDLCELRVVAAITPGPFRQLPEMIYGRTLMTVDLDVPVEGTLDLRNQIVGRYLNGVRWGDASLLAASPRVDNRCASCPFGEAHADRCFQAFGSLDVDGIGKVSLFPLTPEAVERASRAVSAGGDAETFIPRFLLTQVLRSVLVWHHSDLEAGRYPNSEISDHLVPVAERLTDYEREDLAREWELSGASPSAIARGLAGRDLFGDYSASLGSFLDMPVEEDEPTEEPTDEPTDEPPVKPPVKPTDEPPPPPVDVVELDRWSRAKVVPGADAELGQAVLQRVRKSLRARLVAHAASGGSLDTDILDLDDRFRDVDVVVAGAGARARAPRFDVDDRHDAALMKLVWDEKGRRDEGEPRTFRYRLDRLLDEGAEFVGRHVFDVYSTPDTLTDVVRTWVIATALSTGADSTDLPSLLHARVLPGRQDPRWDAVRQSAARLRESALDVIGRLAGFRMGPGKRSVLDAPRVMRALEDVGPDLRIDFEHRDMPGDLALRLGELNDALARSEALETVSGWHALVREHLAGDAEQVCEGLLDLRKAILAARAGGYFEMDEYVYRPLVELGPVLESGDFLDTLRAWQVEASGWDGESPDVRGLSTLARHFDQQGIRNKVRGLLKNGMRLVADVEIEPPRDAGSANPAEQVRHVVDQLSALVEEVSNG